MSILSSLLRYSLIMLGVGLMLIVGFLWQAGFFSAMIAFQLPPSDGPFESNMREMYDLYQRGSGMDDAVASFVSDHADVYLEPTISLLLSAQPESEIEEVAMLFAGFYSGDCRVEGALLERVLSSESHSSRLSAVSHMYGRWDEVELFPEQDSIVKTTLIRFHEDPVIELPPDAWFRFGSKQHLESVAEREDLSATARFAASQLTSAERRELMYWLESLSGSGPPSQTAAKALANLGADYYLLLSQPNNTKLSDRLEILVGWIAEAELNHVDHSCNTEKGEGH